MIATNPSNQQGKVVQVIGPVVDVKFESAGLPEINTALTLSNPAIDATPDNLVIEVAQHLGEQTCAAWPWTPPTAWCAACR